MIRAVLAVFIGLFNFNIMGQTCPEITEKIDKFTGDKRYTSPYAEKITFVKNIKGLDTTYYAYFKTYAGSVNISKKGLYILFKDGSKIISEDLDVQTNYSSANNNYSYSALLRLDKSQVYKFKSVEVTDFKIYIYEDTIDGENGIKYRYLATCTL